MLRETIISECQQPLLVSDYEMKDTKPVDDDSPKSQTASASTHKRPLNIPMKRTVCQPPEARESQCLKANQDDQAT